MLRLPSGSWSYTSALEKQHELQRQRCAMHFPWVMNRGLLLCQEQHVCFWLVHLATAAQFDWPLYFGHLLHTYISMLMCVQTHIQTHTNAHAHCAGMHMHVHAHTHRERESKRHMGKNIPNNSIVRTGQEKWSHWQSRGMQAILYNGSCFAIWL